MFMYISHHGSVIFIADSIREHLNEIYSCVIFNVRTGILISQPMEMEGAKF